MKSGFASISVLVVFIVLLTLTAAAQSSKVSINDLSWMAGCWEMTNPERQLLITEQWMKPAGGMIIGAARTVRDGKVIEYEFLRVVEDADGIYYVAKPTANKDETRFKLITGIPNEVIFENPTHDFPQRVIYRRHGEKLSARIEGTANGKARGIDFPYLRVKCE